MCSMSNNSMSSMPNGAALFPGTKNIKFVYFMLKSLLHSPSYQMFVLLNVSIQTSHLRHFRCCIVAVGKRILKMLNGIKLLSMPVTILYAVFDLL